MRGGNSGCHDAVRERVRSANFRTQYAAEPGSENTETFNSGKDCAGYCSEERDYPASSHEEGQAELRYRNEFWEWPEAAAHRN